VIEGLWVVRYYGPQGTGGGVVVLIKGQVLGGDSGFTYSGTYDLKDNLFKAKVIAKNFDSAVPNVLGFPGDLDLLIEGTLQGEEISAMAVLAKLPDSKIVVKLKKITDLR
jgi:hypothetical protein